MCVCVFECWCVCACVSVFVGVSVRVCVFVCGMWLFELMCVYVCLLVGGSDGDGAYMVLIIKHNLDSQHSEPLRQTSQFKVAIFNNHTVFP